MIDVADYCRQIETHLCQKNDGHLIRIVGPAFEQVCGWAELGVPLKVAFRGIDRYCERYYAKGGRRRPVRIEFCEADVLELFDDWRRAVGVTADRPLEPAKKGGLAAHIERLIARLGQVRSTSGRSEAFVRLVNGIIDELERSVPDAQRARGESRTALVDRLAALDGELMMAAGGEIDAAAAVTIRREAEAELAPFGSRMPPDARSAAVEAAGQRLLRETLGLPVLRYE